MIEKLQRQENRVRLIDAMTVIVPAYGSYRTSLSSAEFLKCEKMSPQAELQISYNDLTKIPFKTGDRYRKSDLANGYLETIEIFNDTEDDVTVDLLFGSGDFENQAVTVSGAVHVRPDGSFLPVEIGSVCLNVPIRETGYAFNSAYNYTLNNKGYGEFELFDIDYEGNEWFGKFLFQNLGNNEMRLFDPLGPIVLPGGSFEMATQAHQRISFYGTPGESASVTSFAMME